MYVQYLTHVESNNDMALVPEQHSNSIKISRLYHMNTGSRAILVQPYSNLVYWKNEIVSIKDNLQYRHIDRTIVS